MIEAERHERGSLLKFKQSGAGNVNIVSASIERAGDRDGFGLQYLARHKYRIAAAVVEFTAFQLGAIPDISFRKRREPVLPVPYVRGAYGAFLDKRKHLFVLRLEFRGEILIEREVVLLECIDHPLCRFETVGCGFLAYHVLSCGGDPQRPLFLQTDGERTVDNVEVITCNERVVGFRLQSMARRPLLRFGLLATCDGDELHIRERLESGNRIFPGDIRAPQYPDAYFFIKGRRRCARANSRRGPRAEVF